MCRCGHPAGDHHRGDGACAHIDLIDLGPHLLPLPAYTRQ